MTHYGDEKKTCRHSQAERLGGHEAGGLALDNVEQSWNSPLCTLAPGQCRQLLSLCGLVGYPFEFMGRIRPGSLFKEHSVLTDMGP